MDSDTTPVAVDSVWALPRAHFRSYLRLRGQARWLRAAAHRIFDQSVRCDAGAEELMDLHKVPLKPRLQPWLDLPD